MKEENKDVVKGMDNERSVSMQHFSMSSASGEEIEINPK
jgi:hypothetical protein